MTGVESNHGGTGDGRIRVPDPNLMRRAGVRMVRVLILVLILATFLTSAGMSLVAAGELPGVPLALGGATLQVALIAIGVAVLRVRRSLICQTISRTALASARRMVVTVRRVAFLAVVALLAYALARAAVGDRWTLLSAGLVDLALWMVVVGAGRLRAAYDQSLGRSMAVGGSGSTGADTARGTG